MVMKVRMKSLHTCVTRCQVSALGTIRYGPWPAFTGVKLVPWHLQCTVLVTLLNRMSHVGGNLCKLAALSLWEPCAPQHCRTSQVGWWAPGQWQSSDSTSVPYHRCKGQVMRCAARPWKCRAGKCPLAASQKPKVDDPRKGRSRTS